MSENNGKQKSIEELKQENINLAHAVQTGVAYKMEIDGGPLHKGETSPKQLRVGVNMALIDSGALLSLLLKKGIVTEREALEELNSLMRAEVASYQEYLSKHYQGAKITLL